MFPRLLAARVWFANQSSHLDASVGGLKGRCEGGTVFPDASTVAIGKQVYGGRSFSTAVFEGPVSSCVSAEWLFSWWQCFPDCLIAAKLICSSSPQFNQWTADAYPFLM